MIEKFTIALKSLFYCFLLSIPADNINAGPMNSPSSDVYQTSIKGTVTNPSARSITVRIPRNIFQIEYVEFNLPLDERNSFKCDFILSEPIYGELSYGSKVTEIFLEPGDDLSVYFNDHDFHNSLFYKGKGGIHNNYIKQARYNYKHIADELILDRIRNFSLAELDKFIEESVKSKKLYLEHFLETAEEPLSATFLSIAKSEIKYWEAYYKMYFGNKGNKFYNVAGFHPEAKSYFSFLNYNLINSSNSFKSKYYLKFLDEYQDFVASKTKELSMSDGALSKVYIKAASALLHKSPDSKEVLTKLGKDEQVLFLNKIEQTYTQDEKMWFLVETNNQEIGWLESNQADFVNPYSYNFGIDSYTQQESRIKKVQVAEVLKNNVPLYKSSYDKEIINSLSYGEELLFLGERSMKEDTFSLFGSIYSDAFYKIRTVDNKVGWVFGGDIYMQASELIEQRVFEKTGYFSLTDIGPMNSYFDGECLGFVVGRNILMNSEQGYTSSLVEKVKLYLDNFKQGRYFELLKKNYEQGGSEALESLKFDSHALVNIPSTATNGYEVAIRKSKESAYSSPEQFVVQPKYSQDSEFNIDLTPTNRRQLETTLIGSVRNHTSGKGYSLSVYPDPIMLMNQSHYLSIKDNTFEKNIKLKDPVAGYLSLGRAKYSIYLNPGDNLSVSFDDNNPDETLDFSGTGAAKNNYLLALRRLFAEEEFEVKTKMKYSDITEYIDYLNASKNAKVELYTRFIELEPFEKDFDGYAKAEIDYWYANSILNYIFERLPYSQPDQAKEEIDQLLFAISNIDVSNDQALLNTNYQEFLDQYFELKLSDPDFKLYNENDLADKFLTGDALFYFRAKSIAKQCARGKVQHVEQDIANFLTACDNDLFNETVKSVYMRYADLKEGFYAPSFDLIDHRGRRVTSDDLLGKIVYLDFWASWCKPCKMHMSRVMNKIEYYNHQDIVFVFVSLDKTFELWQNFVSGSELKGTHLYSSGGLQSSKLAKDYKVKKLPTYFLIGKDGRIVRSSNTKKHTLKLFEQIDYLLQ